jgi:hypothetical protein
VEEIGENVVRIGRLMEEKSFVKRKIKLALPQFFPP